MALPGPSPTELDAIEAPHAGSALGDDRIYPMIVLEHANGWRIVTQQDHARLSGEVASAWDAPDFLPPVSKQRLIEAAIRHDDGWQELDRYPPLDSSGVPFNFRTVPTGKHVAVWRRGLAQIEAEKPFVALLIAQHARWLYTHFSHEGSPEELRQAQAFIDEMTQLMARRLETLLAHDSVHRVAVEPAHLLACRRLLGFYDFLSLRLLGAMGRSQFDEPVAFAERAQRIGLSEDAGDKHAIRVYPWPFKAERIELTCPSTVLTRRSFAGSAEAARAIETGRKETLAWTLLPRV